ncbi:unnamed protein product [Linum trigynum]|uniref:Tf2-1-like SH3-like domain-containing protein n=1 Tax=Linum trigynum TaxID=586398 RepID=A0AAV2DA73_9ROSI
MPQCDGPFQVVSKIGSNAYKIDLPGEYGVSATFNVSDLAPYLDGNSDLRANTFEEGGADEDISWPVTRAKAMTLKEKLATYLESYFGSMDVELFRGKPYMMIRVEEEGGSVEEKADCKKQP